MQFGIIGGGTWATALAKILTDNRQTIYWWMRNEKIVNCLNTRSHNPYYLSSVHFDKSLLRLHLNVSDVFRHCDCLIVAVPSAYATAILQMVPKDLFSGKKIVSAIKGILPEKNLLLNQYLGSEYGVSDTDYFTIMGPCHAEEVAAEKLSYLTFSGMDTAVTEHIASFFKTEYLNTIVNNDITGVQFAAVLKNIYALGAGIAHGLEYGDNFLSVLIANCSDEMTGFLEKAGMKHSTPVGGKSVEGGVNYSVSAYLGDLLVTCYSLFSRNRTFGNMIGKGYSVNAARLEMNMVAEGYNASRSVYMINKQVGAHMPIADAIYRILWKNLHPAEGFRIIEAALV